MNLEQAKSIFASNGITTALLVDDAFDPAAGYGEQELERAFQLFEEEADLADAFTGLGGTSPTGPADLDAQLKAVEDLPEMLQQARTGDEGPLQKLGQALYGTEADDRAGQLKPLEALRAILTDLGIATTPVGSDGPGTGSARYPLIFLDYFLGTKGAPSVEKSRDRIMEIVSHYGPDEMPIVVLMSSELNNERLAREFRDKAELLGCQFQFVMKGKFEEQGFEFVSSLADLVKFLPQTRTIGRFVSSWKKALVAAMSEFQKGIWQLDLQDYFQIRSKMGEKAAARFGDHISGLFDGYLRRLVEDRPELRAATAEMNAISFADRPPAPFAPSETVTKMAEAVAFQALPEAVADDPQSLDLGDVFIREVGTGRNRRLEAAAVISQACDLEQGKTDTVLMIKGVVTQRASLKLSRDAHRPIIRTDLFRYDGKDLIIDWDASDIMTFKLEAYRSWRNEQTFEKVARLRPMQALALQQKYAAHLTRVGLPESPPPYRYPNVEVVYLKDGKKKRLFDPIARKNKFACIIGDEKQEVVLDGRLLSRIREELGKLDRVGIESAVDSANAVLTDYDQSSKLRVNALQDGKVVSGTIAILDSSAELAAGDNLPKNVWLAINLYG